MSRAEEYLQPEVIRTVSRLDLRARFIVEGFLQGLHASPFHGFSVEFSEHRRYSQGDDPADIDWLVYAKTDRYYVKKYESETNITGLLALDLSESMGYTFRQKLSKFEYCVCLAAALGYLMIGQQDPVGLVTFDERVRASLPARSRRSQLSELLALLAKAQPGGQTDLPACLKQISGLLKRRSLVMLFSDLLCDAEPVLKSLRWLRHAGHDVILFHVLDEAEVTFPFDGMIDFSDPETKESLIVDAPGIRDDYREAVAAMRQNYRQECRAMGTDYLALDTSQLFDKALIEFLRQRQARY